MSNSWAKGFIEKAVDQGIIKGYPDGTFKPNNHLTRVQAAALLVRALDLKSDETAPFADIDGYSAVTKAEINAAYKFNIVKGQGGKFKPEEQVTRAQLALMIHRAYDYKIGKKYIPSKKAPYTDFGNYDAETVAAISMLHELGIATGAEGKFSPSNPATRAAAAKILVNFMGNVK
ncbi:S-layer homology domain-containing protein [Sporosarcina sp. NPDC096371]|uniref:S-layer homology domain-containing protein n=1 Tax=Sporosarcina sp. NPDC096371 TaxID=3364530 RepID=UPI0038221622